jgi:ribosomal protein L11 methyltransferase
MFVWSKVSLASEEEMWELRFSGPEHTGLVITEVPHKPQILVEVYCQRKDNALGIQKLYGGKVKEIKQRNWQAEAAKQLKPIAIRGKIIVAHTEEAAAKERKAHPEKIVLHIPGEMAFGTGDHPTTSTCLRLLVDFAKQQNKAGAKWDVLDLGCGTGILALAAKALGAKVVDGCDFDPAAVRISKKNATANGIRGCKFWQEDVLEWKPSRTYPLVLANIFHDVLTVSFAKIAQATAPGGRVVVSGILREQAENVLQAAHEAGLEAAVVNPRGKWATILATKPA